MSETRQIIVKEPRAKRPAAAPIRGEEPAPSASQSDSRGAILIVDDERHHAEGIADVLEGVGYSCDIETSGRGGLDALRRRGFGRVLVDSKAVTIDVVTPAAFAD